MKTITSTMGFSLFALGIHLAIMFSLLPVKNLGLLLAIHAFLAFFLIGGQLLLKKIKSIDDAKVGLTFLAITVFKMLFSLLFILLIYNLSEIARMVLIGNFFGAFFTYLIFEVFLALRQLKQ